MENASQTLHRLTSYEPGREWTEPHPDPLIVQDLQVNDLARLPWFYKRYPASLPRVPLPEDLPVTTAPTVSVLAGVAEVAPAELDLAQLARLLHLSAGVVRTSQRSYGAHLFRAAGSAGGRFPLELYVSVPSGLDLPAGVHWYDPQEHVLVQIGPPPRAASPAIITTGVPWRTGWRYRERGYRHVYWDAGTMLSQLLAAADSAGVPAALYTRFPDAEVAEIVGADGVHEWPVAVVALSGDDPAVEASGPAAAGEVDRAPMEFPLVTTTQRAGDETSWGSAWPDGLPVPVAEDKSEPVETIILARGSTRRMDPGRGLPESTLTTSMEVALRGIDIPHYVAVHDVGEIPPGLYRWPSLTEVVQPGPLREELYRIALEQGLARDAAFVVIAASSVGTLDPRDYRDAQLGAGLVEGRLHLLGYALGAGATGMTFLDSEIPGLLGEPLDALIFTCVGVPDYRSTAGGKPGAPAEVGLVAPRE